MARPSKNGWDFVEEGKIYQYKEDWMILIVEISKDDSDDEWYRFGLTPIAGTDKIDPFAVSFKKNIDGVYSGMPQFYKDAEYMPMPLGKQWKHVFNKEKLDNSEFKIQTLEEMMNA